jgi:Flp pilus assembly protein TadG
MKNIACSGAVSTAPAGKSQHCAAPSRQHDHRLSKTVPSRQIAGRQPPFRFRRVARRQSGAAVVEFAFVLPLLLLLLFGIIEMSVMLYDKAVITNASREATREGIVYSSPYMSSTSIVSVATSNLSKNLITFGGTGTPSASVSPSAGCTASGSPITVTVTYPFVGLAIGSAVIENTPINPLASFAKNALTLTASTTMNCE